MERSPGLSSVWDPAGGRGAPGGGGEHLSSLQDVCRINRVDADETLFHEGSCSSSCCASEQTSLSLSRR